MSSLLKNVKKDIQSKIDTLFANKYKALGFTWAEVKKTRAIQGNQIHEQNLLNKKLYFKNGNEVLHGLDEIFIEEVYKISLPENAFIIDCGAHIGLSVIYLKTKHTDAFVIAFEPDKTNFDLLTKNVSSFGFHKIELKNEAVWKENTVLNFSHEGNMSSKIDTSGSSETNSSSVNAVRLFDIIDRKVDFLKLDIEGAEYEVLKDIQTKLAQIQHLFIEYHGSFAQNFRLNEILQMVTENGFAYYIKEAAPVYQTPFSRNKNIYPYDVQLNIFCFKQ